MQNVCKLMRTRKLNTTAYHQQCDISMVEWFNCTLNPLTAEFSWRRFIHFHLTWVCWLSVLQDFTCCHQTYNYYRPWSAPPGEPPFVLQNHAHSGTPPPQTGWTTQFKEVYQVWSHKVHSWGAAVHGRWLSPKLTNWCSLRPCRSHTSTMMRARGSAPSNPAARGTPPRAPPCVHFNAGGTPKNRGFFPKVCSTYLVIFTHLDHFLRELSFFK